MVSYWPAAEADPSVTGPEREFARLWMAMPRFVLSTILESVRPTLMFPALRHRIGVRLRETRAFDSSVVYLGYEAVR